MGRLFLFTKFFSILLIALFFPILISGSLHFDFKRGKYAFCFKIYKKIRIFGGYASFYPEGIALHVSNKKAILLPFRDLNSKRKNFSFVKTFELLSLKMIVEVPIENLLPLVLLDRILNFVKKINGQLDKYNFLVWGSKDENLKINAKCTLFLNNFILLMNLLQFLWRKIKKICQGKAKKSTI